MTPRKFYKTHVAPSICLLSSAILKEQLPLLISLILELGPKKWNSLIRPAAVSVEKFRVFLVLQGKMGLCSMLTLAREKASSSRREGDKWMGIYIHKRRRTWHFWFKPMVWRRGDVGTQSLNCPAPTTKFLLLHSCSQSSPAEFSWGREGPPT